MSGNGETEPKLTTELDGDISYIRLDERSTISTCSSIVLSSCSGEEKKNDETHSVPTLRWKRQKILNNDYYNSERVPSGNSIRNNSHLDQSFTMSSKENVATILDEERRSIPPRRLPPIPEDKLHRRNPHTVRQEGKMLDDLIPETSLADVQLSEMPGLHNTEQWKRIAGRTVHPSPPLSRQYYQTLISTLELQNGQVPQPLGSYRRPGRSENDQERPDTSASPWRAPRRRILFGSSVAVIIVAIVVAIVLAVTLVQKSGVTTTDYYSGSVSVNAKFDPILFNPSSSLARSYKKDFCTLVATTLADTRTRYALYYSTCSVTGFRNGSIIADFVLGFTRAQNVTRLNWFLNHTLLNKSLFGGPITSIILNCTVPTSSNNITNSTEGDSNEYDESQYDDDDYNDAAESKDETDAIMTEQNLTSVQQEPTTATARTTSTIFTYTTLDQGLSITISETITITNSTNSLDKPPINNKNYELILVPSANNTKTIVVPTVDTNEKSLLSPLLPTPTTTTEAVTGTTNVVTKSPSHHNFLRPIKATNDPNFAYIDESSDDRTFSSGDGTSTLEDLTTQDSTTSNSTISLNDETLVNSASNLVNKPPITSRPSPSRPPPPGRPSMKPTEATSKEEDGSTYAIRSKVNPVKRQRRMVIPKNQRRLLQYELMPTGKVYYVDRPHYNENRNSKDNNDENSSVILSTILSRSSSLDTLSDKHPRHHHHHQQQNRKPFHDLTLKKPEQKLSVGGRLASNNNLPITTSSTSFKPINLNKKKRFSSFEPTPESLDRVFDVLIAADKRREEHEFWREKFDQRPTTSRVPIGTGRIHDTTNSNTVSFVRSKQTPLTSNPPLNTTDTRSKSYTNKRNSLYEAYTRQNGCLLEDCLRRRTLILQQQQQQQQHLQAQRNYSPNTIYSTNYPKQQLLSTTKPPLPTTTSTTTTQQPVRILPLSNGRIGRAPQARQTSDELSTVSDIWATRSSVEDESQQPKKPLNHARFQSTANRNRKPEQKPVNSKRASSVEQQKSNRVQNKNVPTTKNKFFDLFKFNR